MVEPVEERKKHSSQTQSSSSKQKNPTTSPQKQDTHILPFSFPSSHKSYALGLFFSSTLAIKKEAEQLSGSKVSIPQSEPRK